MKLSSNTKYIIVSYGMIAVFGSILSVAMPYMYERSGIERVMLSILVFILLLTVIVSAVFALVHSVTWLVNLAYYFSVGASGGKIIEGYKKFVQPAVDWLNRDD